MRVCDKCGDAAYTQIDVSADESRFDLCDRHYTEFMEWISARNDEASKHKRTRGRRPTSRANTQEQTAEET